MKKLFISTAAIILLLVSNGLFAKNKTVAGFISEIKRTIVIKVEITFGGRNNNCSGKGICKMDVDIIDGIVGTIDYNTDEATLSLSFSKEDVSTYQPDKLQYLTNNKFQLPVDFVFPAEVNKKLGVNKGIVLNAGSYPMTLKDGIYTIHFDNL